MTAPAVQIHIPGFFTEMARKCAAKPWIVRKTPTGWESTSFQKIAGQARAFAAWLHAAGVIKKDRIALVAPGGPEYMAAQMGVFLAGAINVPLSTRLLPAQLRLRLEHCRPRFIIVSPSMHETAAALATGLTSSPGLIYLDNEEEPSGQEMSFSACCEAGRANPLEDRLARIEANISENDDALILYTPETDTSLKAVRFTHANFLALTGEVPFIFDVPRMLRTMIAVPKEYSCIHIAGTFFTLSRGLPLLFSDEPEDLPRSRPLPLGLRYPNPVFFLSEPWVLEKLKKKILRDIERRSRPVRELFYTGLKAGEKYHGDGYNKTPFTTRLRCWLPYYLANRFIYALIRRSFGCRLRFFAGGLSYKDQIFFHTLNIPVFQNYILTEASFAVASNLRKIHKLGSCGCVMPGVSCRILNSGGYPSGIGEVGEICIQGRFVMKGYYKNKEATQVALRSDWLYTGDMGYVDEDGFLSVTGRKSNLLAAPGGEKFSPELIEEAIMSSSTLFRQVFVYNMRHRYTGALVVLDEAVFNEIAETRHLSGKGEVLDAVTEAFFAFTRDPYWNKVIPETWRPLTFRVLEEPFSEQNGTLNSAKKMVRERIIRSCQQLLDGMYIAGGDTPHCEANLEAVWRLTQKTLGVIV